MEEKVAHLADSIVELRSALESANTTWESVMDAKFKAYSENFKDMVTTYSRSSLFGVGRTIININKDVGIINTGSGLTPVLPNKTPLPFSK